MPSQKPAKPHFQGHEAMKFDTEDNSLFEVTHYIDKYRAS